MLIAVEGGQGADRKLNLHFKVEDSGIGIPADKIAHVFGKFTQAEESTTRKFGGTGLGLAISKKLVEMMEGTIGVTKPKDLAKARCFISMSYCLRVNRSGPKKAMCPIAIFPACGCWWWTIRASAGRF